MNKIHALIIEDEIPAARLLANMISSLRPEWNVQTLPGSIEESVNWLATNPHPDLLFLDIQLTDGNSFSLVEQAKPESMIIFTTAYDEYAIRAFTVNSIDYLLKPIHQNRLADSLQKFEMLFEHRKIGQSIPQKDLLSILQKLSAPEKQYRTRFLLSGGDRMFTLPVSEIAYFYSENKVTFAVTRQGREHIVDLSLDRLGEQLDPYRFFRTNRQTMVCVDAIAKVEPYFLGKSVIHVLPPFRERIVISREKIGALKEWLNY